jgi:hypothetical protein
MLHDKKDDGYSQRLSFPKPQTTAREIKSEQEYCEGKQPLGVCVSLRIGSMDFQK